MVFNIISGILFLTNPQFNEKRLERISPQFGHSLYSGSFARVKLVGDKLRTLSKFGVHSVIKRIIPIY